MGYLHYDSATYDVEDETLAYLVVVLATKLRRREPFFVALRCENGSNELIWLHTECDLRFSHSHNEALDVARLQTMMREAASPLGIDLRSGHAQPLHPELPIDDEAGR